MGEGVGQRRRKRTVAEARRRRFWIVFALLAIVIIGLSPLLVASLISSPAPGTGPQLIP
jgi:lipopolysaccharide/colanic/teichoic acid biosynthesis glycosyltransferase